MQYRGPLKGVFLWKSSLIPARRPLPPGGSLPKRCRAGRSSRSPAGWAQARQRSARAWPRGWAAPTQFPARRSPSSTTTAARDPLAHFDLYRIHTENDLAAAGFYDYLDMGAVVACEWSENCADLLEQEQPIHIHINRVDETTRKITIG